MVRQTNDPSTGSLHEGAKDRCPCDITGLTPATLDRVLRTIDLLGVLLQSIADTGNPTDLKRLYRRARRRKRMARRRHANDVTSPSVLEPHVRPEHSIRDWYGF